MSPSINDIAKKIERDLQKGDILVWTNADKEHFFYRLYEIVETNLEWTAPKGSFSSFIGQKKDKGMRIRELTPYGPTEYTFIVRMSTDEWDDVVLGENRTDRPTLKER
ncbi:hypothetical protein HY502_00740 [Candidatus Woesebacteria bacterium]|nr:hypothetical protein [Candidatus Woesebacteria bacterium]